jgi:hypothetical protein
MRMYQTGCCLVRLPLKVDLDVHPVSRQPPSRMWSVAMSASPRPHPVSVDSRRKGKAPIHEDGPDHHLLLRQLARGARVGSWPTLIVPPVSDEG